MFIDYYNNNNKSKQESASLSLSKDTCYHLTLKVSFLFHWMTVTKFFFQVYSTPRLLPFFAIC